MKRFIKLKQAFTLCDIIEHASTLSLFFQVAYIFSGIWSGF
jgi:hypothetical protein